MENKTDNNIEKAMTLMAQAMKEYEEGKFDLADSNRREANRLFDEASDPCSSKEKVKAACEQLSRYLENGFRSDYEADERGLIPIELKRGVLSQDALYDLLEERG